MWAMVVRHARGGFGRTTERDGYDVGHGGFVLSGAAVGPRVVEAYRRAETERRERLSEFMTGHGVPHAMVAGSADIRTALTAMTGVYARAR